MSEIKKIMGTTPPPQLSGEKTPTQNTYSIIIGNTCLSLASTIQNIASTSVSPTTAIQPLANDYPYTDGQIPADINLMYALLAIYNYVKQHPGETDPSKWPAYVKDALDKLNNFDYTGSLNSLESLAADLLGTISESSMDISHFINEFQNKSSSISGFITYLFSSPNFPSFFSKTTAYGTPNDLSYYLNMSYLLIENLKSTSGASHFDDSMWFKQSGTLFFPDIKDIIYGVISYQFQKSLDQHLTVNDFEQFLWQLKSSVSTVGQNLIFSIIVDISTKYSSTTPISDLNAWYQKNGAIQKEMLLVGVWKNFSLTWQPNIPTKDEYETEAKALEWLTYLYQYLQKATGDGSFNDSAIINCILALQNIDTNPNCNADTKALLDRVLKEFSDKTGRDPTKPPLTPLDSSTLNTYRSAFNASFSNTTSGYAVTSYNLIQKSLPKMYGDWDPLMSVSLIIWAANLDTIPSLGHFSTLDDLLFNAPGSGIIRPKLDQLGPALLAYFYQLEKGDDVKANLDFQAFLQNLPEPTAASPFFANFADAMTRYSATYTFPLSTYFTHLGISPDHLLNLLDDVITSCFHPDEAPESMPKPVPPMISSIVTTKDTTPPTFYVSKNLIPSATGNQEEDTQTLFSLKAVAEKELRSSSSDDCNAFLAYLLEFLAKYDQNLSEGSLDSVLTDAPTGESVAVPSQSIISTFTLSSYKNTTSVDGSEIKQNLQRLINNLYPYASKGLIIQNLIHEASLQMASISLDVNILTNAAKVI